MSDVEFFLDPVCPWAWVTSRWVVEVASQRSYDVEWRFICLRIVNEEKDFEHDPTSPYGRVHGAGRMMLRAAAAARVAGGNDAVGRLYTEYGTRLHNQGRSAKEIREADYSLIGEAITAAGFGSDIVAAADDEKWDEVLREETAVALESHGRRRRHADPHVLTRHRGGDLVLRAGDQPNPSRPGGPRDLGLRRATRPHARDVRVEANAAGASRLHLTAWAHDRGDLGFPHPRRALGRGA